MYTFLQIEKLECLATITLNRPERYNALNKTLCEEIAQAIKALDKDETVKVIRIKGAGKGFCAGLDLFEVDITELKEAGKIIRELFNPMVLAIKKSTKPVVAQVTGAAAGAGCSLALACDLVFASTNAMFSLPFVNIALLPDTGASYFITKQVGYKKAFELLSGGGAFKANEAEACMLINRVCNEELLDAECIQYCLGLAKTSNLNHLKSLLQSAEAETLEQTLDLEAYYQDKVAKLPRFEAAIKKFKERKQ
jgi:2-(1,2-epoxy-1,2-dihydrophenyl)acetyl-CoA isomerase